MAETHEFSGLPMLSSPQNPRVKEYLDLRNDGNVRREQQRFFLEGKRAVEAALSLRDTVVHEVIFSDHILGEDLALVRQARMRKVPLTRTSKDVFRKIADVMTPQGIAAVVEIPAWDASEILGRSDAVLVAACGLQDPGNVGTLIRSCEAAGATGLVITEGTADPFNAKVVRATAAGLLTLPILRMKTPELLKMAAQLHLRMVATSAHDGKRYKKFDWTRRPLMLCIGSEGEGLPPAIEEACTEKVTIPMKGEAESLNAAVAASILLFHALAE